MAEAEPQRRGAALRRHILFAAKEVLLETGYERASMDAVAARAQTSKRSLYAHFRSKEALLLAVLDLVRGLYLDRLGTPDGYARRPVEAVTRYCARLVQLTTWEPQLRTCRLVLTEAERLPASAQAYYDAIVVTACDRLRAYLVAERLTTRSAAARTAQELVDRAVLPQLFRTLLSVEPGIAHDPEIDTLAADVDLRPIRRVVTAVLTP